MFEYYITKLNPYARYSVEEPPTAPRRIAQEDPPEGAAGRLKTQPEVHLPVLRACVRLHPREDRSQGEVATQKGGRGV